MKHMRTGADAGEPCKETERGGAIARRGQCTVQAYGTSKSGEQLPAAAAAGSNLRNIEPGSYGAYAQAQPGRLLEAVTFPGRALISFL